MNEQTPINAFLVMILFLPEGWNTSRDVVGIKKDRQSTTATKKSSIQLWAQQNNISRGALIAFSVSRYLVSF